MEFGGLVIEVLIILATNINTNSYNLCAGKLSYNGKNKKSSIVYFFNNI